MIDMHRDGMNAAAIAELLDCDAKLVSRRLRELVAERASRGGTIKCMRCRQLFESRDKTANRLCSNCRQFADDVSRSSIG